VSLAALVVVPSTITFVILAAKCTGSRRSRDNPSPWWVLGLWAPPTLLLLLLDAYVLERWVYPAGCVWCLLQAAVELAHYNASRRQSHAEMWFRVDTKTLLHLLIESPAFVESQEDQFRRWLRRAPWHRLVTNAVGVAVLATTRNSVLAAACLGTSVVLALVATLAVSWLSRIGFLSETVFAASWCHFRSELCPQDNPTAHLTRVGPLDPRSAFAHTYDPYDGPRPEPTAAALIPDPHRAGSRHRARQRASRAAHGRWKDAHRR
jgi:hypothetical protein